MGKTFKDNKYRKYPDRPKKDKQQNSSQRPQDRPDVADEWYQQRYRPDGSRIWRLTWWKVLVT